MIRVITIAAVATMCVAPARAGGEDDGLSYRRLYLRAGVLHVAPLSRSSELSLAGVDGPASLAVMEGPVAGSGVALDPFTIPALIVGYVLPIGDDRFSIETVLGPPLRVRFRATGTLADQSIAPEALGIPTGVPAFGSELGEVDALPPMVTAVVRVADLGPVHPYVGTGVGVVIHRNARLTNPILTEVGEPRFDVDPSFGWVLQSGIDVALWRRLYARVDVKYVAFMRAHGTVTDLRVRTPGLPLLESAEVGTATMDVWINPLTVLFGAGVDF